MDAVITWVDGESPHHAAKRASYASNEVHLSSCAATRFACRGEIRFCVASILRFCPWVGRVFIVTDEQYPRAIDPILARRADWRARVEVVDHRTIYGEHADVLPVFSSCSIETMLHRIPDLAEEFIYLNDDMFIGRPLAPAHFFRSGVPVLRGRLVRFPHPLTAWAKARLRSKPRRAGFREAQLAAARLVGARGRFLLAGHHPQAMRRSTLARFFEGRPALLRAEAGHRFRSPDQVSPTGLANHLELAAGAPVEVTTEAGFIKPPRSAKVRAAMGATLAALERSELASLCVQSLDMMEPVDRDAVLAALERRFAAISQPGKPITFRREALLRLANDTV